MEYISILKELGATPAVILIFVMGVMFSTYMVLRDRARSKLIDMLIKEGKETLRLYHQVDKEWYALAKVFQAKFPEVKLVHSDLTADGEHTLDRSV